MNLSERIQAFADTGRVFKDFLSSSLPEGEFQHLLENALQQAEQENPWFTQENIRFTIHEKANALTKENLGRWLSDYPSLSDFKDGKKIGMVAAGNIPLAGFHDVLCILLSGHKALIKLSLRDQSLMKCILQILCKLEPGFTEHIELTEGIMHEFDAVIATGSNQSARYFNSYFGKYPHIIRKNRNGIAILNGTESKEELTQLGEDIFRYFGLGCRNISKLYLPDGYDIRKFFEAMEPWYPVVHHHHYANNYEYYRAIYMVSKIPIFDNGFLILKEDPALSSPVAVLFYEYYKNEEDLARTIDIHLEEIQCIVSTNWKNHKSVVPGQAQLPQLWDYADGIDTLHFLTSL